MSLWVDAFNVQDLDGMLAHLSEDVDFHPLRLSGLRSFYRGHDGVREWFRRQQSLRHDCRITVTETREVGDGRVFVSGLLGMGGGLAIGPVCGLHRVDGGLIVAARHYLTDPDMIERLGLIP